jgi:elongation factor G
MYYEIITRAVEATLVHKKIVSGGGEFAKVILRLEPLPDGSGFQFINDAAADVLPAELVDGAREGVVQAAAMGVLAGHPVTDVRVTLVDGAYHESTRTDIRSISRHGVHSGTE